MGVLPLDAFAPRPVNGWEVRETFRSAIPPGYSWAEASDADGATTDQLWPEINRESSADRLWFQSPAMAALDTIPGWAECRVESEFSQILDELFGISRSESTALRLDPETALRIWTFTHGLRVEPWTPAQGESEELQQIHRTQRQALAARRRLDQLIARALLRRSRAVKPQILVVDMPIEPMAPCAPTFS